MNKLEYIPGDLVMTKTEPNDIIPNGVVCKFNEYVFRDKVYVCTVMLADNFICKKEDIAPIPLTPEILKKNGWVKDTHRHCLDGMPAEAYEKKDFPLTHFNVTFGKKRIQASHDCLFVRNLKYVSDLQHLLFGLGLNSEMEV